MFKKIILLIFSVWVGLLGCSGNVGIHREKSGSTQTQQKGKTQQEKKPLFKAEQAQNARWIAKNVAGVDDATAVVMDEEVFLAAKVTNFHRLRMKNIRKELHQKLKTQFKEYKVHVTTDSKLYKEIEKAEKEIETSALDYPTKIKKKMKKIHDAMKG